MCADIIKHQFYAPCQAEIAKLLSTSQPEVRITGAYKKKRV